MEATKVSSLCLKKRFGGLVPFVLDLETGGTHYKTDALLEMAACSLQFDEHNQLQQKDLFSCHVLPFEGARLDPKALEINGILDPYHPFRLAIPEEQALKQLFTFIKKELKTHQCPRAVLVGHNAHFDLYFLLAAAARCQLKSPFHSFTVFDTATLGGMLYSQTVLSRLAQAADIPFNPNEAHGAIYDVEITTTLFCKIVNQLQEQPFSSNEWSRTN